jgi:hypothetical protein
LKYEIIQIGCNCSYNIFSDWSGVILK